MGVVPLRTRPYWQYLPLVSIACLVWWITGMCLWIHYTQTAYNKSLDVRDILQITVGSGISNQISRIYSSLVATCILFTLGAILIHALGIWRGVVEVEQDTSGHLNETINTWISWANIGTQVIWYVVMIWMIVMLVGYGAFAAYIYSIRSALANVVLLQTVLPGGMSPILLPGYCPVSCLSTVSTGIFLYTKDTIPGSATSLVCICDNDTLVAAFNSASEAYSAIPGMLAGVLFLVVYGVVLLAYLTAMLIRTNTEQDMSERLSAQGFHPAGERGYK